MGGRPVKRQDTHIKVVREWCQSLGVLTAVTITRQEADLKLAAYIPMLVQRFPDAAFTPESLQHCAAAAVKGFPTYGELAASLAAHWRANRPEPPRALPPPAPRPPRPEPTEAEREHVARATRELVAELSARWSPAEHHPRAKHLSPGVLDQINPLPGGRKRTTQGAPPAC